MHCPNPLNQTRTLLIPTKNVKNKSWKRVKGRGRHLVHNILQREVHRLPFLTGVLCELLCGEIFPRLPSRTIGDWCPLGGNPPRKWPSERCKGIGRRTLFPDGSYLWLHIAQRGLLLLCASQCHDREREREIITKQKHHHHHHLLVQKPTLLQLR